MRRCGLVLLDVQGTVLKMAIKFIKAQMALEVLDGVVYSAVQYGCKNPIVYTASLHLC